MKYKTGEEIKIGDRVKNAEGAGGFIVRYNAEDKHPLAIKRDDGLGREAGLWRGDVNVWSFVRRATKKDRFELPFTIRGVKPEIVLRVGCVSIPLEGAVARIKAVKRYLTPTGNGDVQTTVFGHPDITEGEINGLLKWLGAAIKKTK